MQAALRRRGAALLLFGAGVGAPHAAAAAPGLLWQAPSECPRAEEVTAAVAELLARPPRWDSVRVELSHTGSRWRARLVTPEGERRFEGESCQAVTDAVTVVLALASEAVAAPAAAPESVLAPTADAAAAANRSLGTPPVVADSAADSVPSPAPAPRAATSASEAAPLESGEFTLSLQAGLLAEVGMLPGPSIGPRLGVGLVQRGWSLEVGVAALLPRHAELGGIESGAADIHWLGGQVVVCRVIQAPLTTCMGAESGQLIGTGSGVDAPLTASGWWLAGLASALLRGPLASGALPVSWELGVSLALAAVRPQFGFDDLGVLHRASGLSGRFLLGLGWH